MIADHSPSVDLELRLRRRIERLQLALRATGLTDERILAITHDGEQEYETVL